MLTFLKGLFTKPAEQKIEIITEKPKKKAGFFNSKRVPFQPPRQEWNAAKWDLLQKQAIQRRLASSEGGAVTTGMDSKLPAPVQFATDSFVLPQVSGVVADWYGSQGFIGYQMCAILAQQWLIDKACTMPAQDCIRKGWEITLNDGNQLTPKQLDYIRELDVRMKVMQNLKEYIRCSRIFGIRVAMFLVDSDDKDYYSKPFNIDGVKPGSYKGITQIDPYWMAPELDMAASADPVNKDFYEPTYWMVSGMKIHKSHLCVLIPYPVADVLKPTYFFGGIPLTQKIYERVYNAERCATESPQLLMTKRANVVFCDIEAALADQQKFEERMMLWSNLMNNYGIKTMGEEERFEQHDTSLTDLDTTILTQYELVAAIAEVPSAKLLGQAPSGSLNASGQHETSSYREMLESIQANDLTPFLSRHYMLLVKSYLGEKFPDLASANLVVRWIELNSMTERERAEVNEIKARTDKELIDMGAIDGGMVHDRIVKDPNSGYAGVEGDLEEEPEEIGESEEGEGEIPGEINPEEENDQ